MANLTKNVGTVTLTGTAEKVALPAVYGWVWVKNMSEGDIFAGLSEDISKGADGVMVIPSGECGRIQADGFNSVYLLGTGNALVVAQNYADCPFKAGGKGGELPVASIDTLGGVMVDGTSITADEQGVISAVGSGGGLTLLGRYANTHNGETTIGTLSDIPEGTKLLFMSTKLSGTVNEVFYCGIGNVPTYVKGYERSYSNISMINGNNDTLTLQIHNYGPSGNKVTFVGNGSFVTYFDIYKSEV